ncbi:MAG: cobalt transporter CbiM [Candidatus Gastranaerophilales bacterium]|nr:cobalt transporter CbiM [Candidatus Gastranaerophilales bacterium]
MHIPGHFLCPFTCLSSFVVMIPIWIATTKKIKKTLKPEYIKAIALGSAFSFAVMMLNVPIPEGSTGHAIGAVLLSILFGPYISAIAITMALAIQAVIFGDGGINTFAVNSFNIAYVTSFTGFYLYKYLLNKLPKNPVTQIIASGISSYCSIIFASFITGLILGLQPILAHTANGTPLYFPYSLNVSIPVMVSEHVLFFGWVEAFITMAMVTLLLSEKSHLSNLIKETGTADVK